MPNCGCRSERRTCGEECVKVHHPPRSFCVPLTFFQELVSAASPPAPPGTFTPLSNTNAIDPGITGYAKVLFSEDFSSIRVRLYVFNALNPMNRIVAAHFHVGAANVNGNVTAFIYGLPGQLPVNVNGFLTERIIRNADITPQTAEGFRTNSVASIYEAARRGLIYINVHSEQIQPGAIRGQLFIN